ncbi:MAG: hypothetical protein F4Y75_02585 [Acidimicrobiia bacterium]|nr:hypothetical protein [Acidimicrobiia bacterium]MYF26056.1 hypothetical protein [Acidimicrobiia bacterium]MYH55453.1 hypothetical protein [Acidimicrobiia bacterium]
MKVKITIKDVPEEVRDKLAAQAALNRQSLQDYLLVELERIADRPPAHVLPKEIEQRGKASGKVIPASEILEARDADRK